MADQLSVRELAAAVDELASVRKRRLALQKEVDSFAAREKELCDLLIDNLSVSDACGLSGKLATATIVPCSVPVVEDWDALYSYVVVNRAFDLLQRRLSTRAVQDRWDNKELVPGVKVFNFKRVSLTNF